MSWNHTENLSLKILSIFLVFFYFENWPVNRHIDIKSFTAPKGGKNGRAAGAGIESESGHDYENERDSEYDRDGVIERFSESFFVNTVFFRNYASSFYPPLTIPTCPLDLNGIGFSRFLCTELRCTVLFFYKSAFYDVRKSMLHKEKLKCK